MKDVLIAYDLTEHVLFEIYEGKDKKLRAVAKKNNQEKGARKMMLAGWALATSVRALHVWSRVFVRHGHPIVPSVWRSGGFGSRSQELLFVPDCGVRPRRRIP